MAEIIDLRQFRRSPGDHLVAEIDEELVAVINVSPAGMRVGRPVWWIPRRNVEFRVIPQTAAGLDFDRAIPILGHVVGHTGDHLRIAFASISRRLASLIEAHAEEEPLPAMVQRAQP